MLVALAKAHMVQDVTLYNLAENTVFKCRFEANWTAESSGHMNDTTRAV